MVLFIFSAVMTSVTVYFGGIARANQNARRLQQNLEDVRFSMNRITKVLRTSVIITSSATTIKVFDYSQNRCVSYGFTTDSIQEGSLPKPLGTVDEKPWCAGAILTLYPIVSVAPGESISGRFSAVPSSKTPPNETAGRVTMSVRITRQNNSSVAQTTMSLRNYKEVYP